MTSVTDHAATTAGPAVGGASSPVLGGAGTPHAAVPLYRIRRVGLRDVIRIAGSGLRSRVLRSTLTALGIAIGVAAMMGVLAISESSRAALLAQLDSLGTNLLTVTAGQTFLGQDSSLPEAATGMIRRVNPVEGTAAVATLDATVRRTDFIDSEQTGGIAVQAADLSLLDTLQGSMQAGRWLDAATEQYPAVVLGAVAAERLGIDDVSGPVMVWIGDRWFSVVGILEALPLAPEIDRSVLIGTTAARDTLRLGRLAVHDLRAHRPGPRDRCARRAARDDEPREHRGGRRQPAIRRARGQGRRRDHLHQPLPRPGGRRPARGRPGHRQHDAHGRPRAALGDRPPSGARARPGGRSPASSWPRRSSSPPSAGSWA